MNPSAQGWINKFHLDYSKDIEAISNLSITDFYNTLKQAGFIYGTNLSSIVSKQNSEFKLTQEELAKVNLYTALCVVFRKANSDNNKEDCLRKILDFYTVLKKTNQSLFQFKWSKNQLVYKIESIMHQRVQTSDTYLKKNFSNVITNAFLLLDVLCFERFLKEKDNVCGYAKTFEKELVNIILLALRAKQFKGKYDEVIINLIQSSLRYHQIEKDKLKDINELDFTFISSKIEKSYIVDMVCMTLYSDEKIDETERIFISQLLLKLNIKESDFNIALDFLNDFVNANKTEISFFNVSNPIKYFYDNTHRSITVLIHRNKKRIINEIYQSKELMQLLVSSTYRELDKNEKKKIKSQLIDIFKTIPSLTLFALPGGSLLLPIIIKLIPTILPSSFNENLIEEQEK